MPLTSSLHLLNKNTLVTSYHSPTHQRIQPQGKCLGYMGPREPACAAPQTSVFLHKLDEKPCHLLLKENKLKKKIIGTGKIHNFQHWKDTGLFATVSNCL